MRKLILCLVFALSRTIILAQPAIEKEYHLFRTNDYLYKQQVEFISPGNPGESLLWDFSTLKVVDEKYKVSYTNISDSLFIARELRTLYKYAVKGDTLVSTGIESNLLLMDYCWPEMQLIYPVNYGDKVEIPYYGQGDYCKQFNLIHSGVSAYHADAWGAMILPEGDTLQHVLRVKHTRKQLEDNYPYSPFTPDIHFSTDTIYQRLANDTLWTQTDTYRWYAAGYRYPVFESITYFIYRHGTPEPAAATSFYYSPYEQYYGLEDDPENREKREVMAMQTEENQPSRSRKQSGNPGRVFPQPVEYVINHTQQNNTVSVEYQVVEPVNISLTLFDVHGRILKHIPEGWKEIGSYREELDLSAYLKGEYIVRITIGEETYIEKIIN